MASAKTQRLNWFGNVYLCLILCYFGHEDSSLSLIKNYGGDWFFILMKEKLNVWTYSRNLINGDISDNYA